ncbi:hypothetical protein QJS66_15595 [Kocuria rhizophila]|nr:hypothetical protein QJS66_15595 [Kocuria rhizophila]
MHQAAGRADRRPPRPCRRSWARSATGTTGSRGPVWTRHRPWRWCRPRSRPRGRAAAQLAAARGVAGDVDNPSNIYTLDAPPDPSAAGGPAGLRALAAGA